MISQILGTQWGCKVQHQNIYRDIPFIKTSECYIFKDNFWKHSDINSIGPVYFKLLSQVMSNRVQGWMQSITKYQIYETFLFYIFNATVFDISKRYFWFYCHNVFFNFKLVFRLFMCLEKLRINFSTTHFKDQYFLLPPLNWYTTHNQLAKIWWGSEAITSTLPKSLLALNSAWYI